LRPALARVPVRSAIIDCELVACDETGMPSFRSLMNLGNKAPALWCFDLLSLDGARITPLPLVERRALLGKIVTAASTRHLQFSGEFDDPVALLDMSANEPRGHCLEAERLRLPTGADSRLAQSQNRRLACSEPRTLGTI
jgi:ATP-dependent DNA ligase